MNKQIKIQFPDTYTKGGITFSKWSKDDFWQEQFQEWMEDGNVTKNADGTYSTQDAQYTNSLRGMVGLKKYFYNEFIKGQYADGGRVGVEKGDIINIKEGDIISKYEVVQQPRNNKWIEVQKSIYEPRKTLKLSNLYTDEKGSVWHTEGSMYAGGGMIDLFVNDMVKNQIARRTLTIKDNEKFNQFMNDIQPYIDKKIVRVKVNPINKQEVWVSLQKLDSYAGGGMTKRKPKEKVLNVRARGGFTLDDFNPLLDYYDQVVSYKKIGELELQQIVGKNYVEDEFEFNTEKDRDYWYEILSEEQEKYFTIKNKKKYVNYILEWHDPYSEKAEDEGITKKSEMLDYFANEIYDELRYSTDREDFIRKLDLKNKFESGGTLDDINLVAKAIEYITGSAIEVDSIQFEANRIAFRYKGQTRFTDISQKLIEDTISMHRKSLEMRGRYADGGEVKVNGLTKQDYIDAFNNRIEKLIQKLKEEGRYDENDFDYLHEIDKEGGFTDIEEVGFWLLPTKTNNYLVDYLVISDYVNDWNDTLKVLSNFYFGKPMQIKFVVETGGDLDLVLEDELQKIKLLSQKIDFNKVVGVIDYEKAKDNTDLDFYKGVELIMSVNGDWNEETEELDTLISFVDGENAELNYHPLDSMGGVNFEQLEKNINEAFKELNTYSAVVSIEGYEEYAEDVEGLENAKNVIQDIKGNTRFQVLKGSSVGIGKRVDDSRVVAEFEEGGETSGLITDEQVKDLSFKIKIQNVPPKKGVLLHEIITLEQFDLGDEKNINFYPFHLIYGDSSLAIFDAFGVDEVAGLKRADAEKKINELKAQGKTEKDGSFIAGLTNYVGDKLFMFFNVQRLSYEGFANRVLPHEALHLSRNLISLLKNDWVRENLNTPNWWEDKRAVWVSMDDSNEEFFAETLERTTAIAMDGWFRVTGQKCSVEENKTYRKGGEAGKLKDYIIYSWKSKNDVVNDNYEITNEEEMTEKEVIELYQERMRRGYDFAVQIYEKGKNRKQIYSSKSYDDVIDALYSDSEEEGNDSYDLKENILSKYGLHLEGNRVRTNFKSTAYEIANEYDGDVEQDADYYIVSFRNIYAKGGEVEFDNEGTSMAMYHEKKGNWLVPKGQVYLWLYDVENSAEKIESEEFDYVQYPLTAPIMAFQRGYIPPLKRIWTKKFQKNNKGSEHLLGVIKAYLIEEEGKKELYIDMMSVNPKKKKKGIMSYMIKDLRDTFNLTQDQVTFSDLTDEGKKFVGKKTYDDGGGVEDLKNRIKMDSEIMSLLYPNERQFLLQSDTKVIENKGLIIITDGKREIVFSKYKTKLKKLGNASQSTKKLFNQTYADGGDI